MSYVYIKPGGFNIKNMIIKEYNNNLVLNYRDSNISITLKNIIFKITSNPIIIDDNKSDNKTKFLKILLSDQLLKNLILIDNKIQIYANMNNIIYIPIVKKYKEYKYITLYLQEEIELKDTNKVDTYIMLKFKMINGQYQSRIHTYKMNIIDN